VTGKKEYVEDVERELNLLNEGEGEGEGDAQEDEIVAAKAWEVSEMRTFSLHSTPLHSTLPLSPPLSFLFPFTPYIF